jgi:hypothetical protein
MFMVIKEGSIIFLLAQLAHRVSWTIAITWRPLSSSSSSVVRRLWSVVRRKLFQWSSPLKLQDQLEPNLVWIIIMVSSFKFVSGDSVQHPTWPLLLKIEHMVKLQVLGNNSKIINNIRNLTGLKWLAHQYLTTLQFGRKSHYPSLSYCPFFIKFSKF